METAKIDEQIILEVVCRGESQKIWKMGNDQGIDKMHFQDEDLDSGEKVFVVYLNGLSLNQQIIKTGGQTIDTEKAKRDLGFRQNAFWIQPGSKEIASARTAPGYYLIKVTRSLDTPPGWRKAEVNEASEFLQTLLKTTKERLLQKEMHIVKTFLKGRCILAVGSFQEGRGVKLFLGPREKMTEKLINILVKEP